MSIFRKIAWVYAITFLATVAISHWPSFTDAQGLLFGLYHVSPLIDAVHFLAGIIAVIVAFHSTKWSINYFKIAGPLFLVDAIISLLFSRDILETFSVFTQGLGGPNLTTTNFLANTPHIIIALIMIWAGYVRSKSETLSK